MGDLAETFKFWGEIKKQRKFLNKELSTKLLNDMRVQFESKNDGNHLIINAPEGIIDFWPSTGLWKDRNNGITRRGVFGLLKFIGIDKQGEKGDCYDTGRDNEPKSGR